MWFFGIVDIDPELRLSLEEEWIPLYSKGDVFYKEDELFPANRKMEKLKSTKVPVSMTVMSFDAMWKDAEARNNNFLDLFKKSIEEYMKENLT